MAYTNIDDPSAHFQTATYTGSNNQSITNDGNSDLQPDFVWIKRRSNADHHNLTNSSLGVNKQLLSSSSNAEQSRTDQIQSFNTDGFTLGTDGAGYTNSPGNTYVGWQWKANAGTTSSNTNGNITSTVQANTTAGFSIVTYTGTGSTGTVGHGLGVVPSVMIIKNREYAASWVVYHKDIHADAEEYGLRLNNLNARESNSGFWNNTAPTSSVFTIGGNAGVNNGDNTDTLVAYCFAEKQGYSKFGKYTGAGSGSPFVYTGFKPALVICKRIDSTNDWGIVDSKRETYNGATKTLFADLTNAESSTYTVDLLSNGFRPASNHSIFNQSGGSYIYMAFAENPFVTSTGIPTTAR
jgi:hypothetical protein